MRQLGILPSPCSRSLGACALHRGQAPSQSRPFSGRRSRSPACQSNLSLCPPCPFAAMRLSRHSYIHSCYKTDLDRQIAQPCQKQQPASARRLKVRGETLQLTWCSPSVTVRERKFLAATSAQLAQRGDFCCASANCVRIKHPSETSAACASRPAATREVEISLGFVCPLVPSKTGGETEKDSAEVKC